jgi:hypothetical protein
MKCSKSSEMAKKQWTEEDIVFALYMLCEEDGTKYCAPNSKRILGYTGESDFLAINNRGMVVEYEIKTTHWDFMRDFQDRGDKAKRHRILSGLADHVNIQAKMPNLFYFVAPKGVIPLSEVPEYAGLIEVYESKDRTGPVPAAEVKKRAPRLHDRVATDRLRMKFLDEMVFRCMVYSRTAYRQRRNENK